MPITQLSDFVRANYIRIGNGKLTGTISTLSYDFQITGKEIPNTKRRGRLFRIFGKSPQGNTIDVGLARERVSATCPTEYHLSIDTGYGPWQARLKPVDDQEELYRIVAVDYLNNLR